MTANNWSRAWEVLGDISPFLHWQAVEVDRVRDALDAAEARGRAEVVAKVEALADELLSAAESAITPGYYRDAADRLRSLIAEEAS